MSAIIRAKTVHFAKIRQIDALWHDSFWLLIMRLVNIAASMLLGILLARALGAEQYGIYAFGLSVLMITVVPARFGFDHYLASEIPPLEKESRFGAVHGLVRRALQTTIIVSLVLLLLWALLWLAASPLQSRELWLSGLIALCGLPFFASLHTRFGALRGQHRTVAGQLPLFVLHPIFALAGFGVIATMSELQLSGLSAQILFALSFAVVTAFVFLALTPSLAERHRAAKAEYNTRHWIRGAAPMMLAGGLAILIGNVGVLLLGPMAGERAAGLYQPATQLAALVAMILTIVNQPLGPKISHLFAEGKRTELQRMLDQVSTICIAISGIFATVFFVWGRDVLQLYGDEFADATPALTVLVIGQLANVAFGPTALVLMMTGEAKLVVRLMALGAAVCLLVSVFLIPAYGVVGAAIGASAALTTWNALAVYYAVRTTGLCPTILLSFLFSSSRAKGAV